MQIESLILCLHGKFFDFREQLHAHNFIQQLFAEILFRRKIFGILYAQLEMLTGFSVRAFCFGGCISTVSTIYLNQPAITQCVVLDKVLAIFASVFLYNDHLPAVYTLCNNILLKD